MRIFHQLISNFPLICTGSAWILAQVLKVFTGIFRVKEFSVTELLFGTGGMPSSHTAAVMALVVSVGMSCGLDSPLLAMAFLFAMITIRDATGVRRETGEQAKVLNRILKNLAEAKDNETKERELKELVGHTPLQVFVGAILGMLVPFMWMAVPFYRGMVFG